MDTRSTRLRRAARTAVAKALNDEKENPTLVSSRTTLTRTTLTGERISRPCESVIEADKRLLGAILTHAVLLFSFPNEE